MKKIFFLLFFFSLLSEVFAYTPSSTIALDSQNLSNRINLYLEKQKSDKKTSLINTLSKQLPVLQARMVEVGNIDRAYLFEYVRRHLPGSVMIETLDLIDDDNRGVTWTHAPQWFELIYEPYDTPSLSKIATQKNFSTFINGAYFARTEWGNYPAWVLYLDGSRYTPFVPDDPQITHVICTDTNGKISFWENKDYTEERLNSCKIAFQSGPMIYESSGGQKKENLAAKQYIGLPHTRTVMVVFTRIDNTQDVWFLTAYNKMTLAQVRDVVLSETRFHGTYNSLAIMNLDGWSSVAYISQSFPELNFGTNKILPIVLGIK